MPQTTQGLAGAGGGGDVPAGAASSGAGDDNHTEPLRRPASSNDSDAESDLLDETVPLTAGATPEKTTSSSSNNHRHDNSNSNFNSIENQRQQQQLYLDLVPNQSSSGTNQNQISSKSNKSLSMKKYEINPKSNGDRKSPGPQNNPKIQHVSDIIGDTGSWQRRVCIFHSTVGFFSAFHSLSKTFYAPKVDFYCPSNLETNHTGLTVKEICAEPCPDGQWHYDRSHFDRTIITEWDLVCDSSWLPSFTQSIYMIGILVSSLFAAQLSDHLGRRLTVRLGLLLEIFAGFLTAFAPNITVFALARFLIALGSYSRGLTGYVLILESLGTRSRAWWTQVCNFGWVAGYITLPWVAYVLRDWRHLQLAFTSLQVVIILPFILWIPESPRWLLTKGKFKQAEAILRQACRINGIPQEGLTEKIEELNDQIRQEKLKEGVNAQKSGIAQLAAAKHLRRTLLIMYYTWLVNGFVYYGISLNVDSFGSSGDALFWSFFFMGLIEAPSYLFNAIALEYVGRRPLTAFLLFGSGIACGAAIFLQGKDLWLVRNLVGLGGKFFIASCYALIYLVAMEVFPTVLRQTATGTCSVASRIGGILAPFVKEIADYSHIGVALGLFALLAITDGFAVLLVPEMKDEEIPDTMAEAEQNEIRNVQKRDSIRRKSSPDKKNMEMSRISSVQQQTA